MLNTITPNKPDQQSLDKKRVSTRTTFQVTPASSNNENVLTLNDIFTILSRRAMSIFLFLFLAVSLALLYSLSVEPTYRAKAMIQIEREGMQIVDFGQIRKPKEVFDIANDPFFRTRYEMLRGRVLSQIVIDELQLKKTLEKNDTGFLSSIKTKLYQKLNIQKEPDNLRKTKEPIDYVGLFQSNLYVQPIPGSHLVEIFYEARTPETAKNIVSTLLKTFIKLQIETISETDEYATKFLAKQLIDSGNRLSKAEAALARYANSSGILKVDDKQTRHLKKLENLDLAMVTAEISKIEKESLYMQMQKVGVVPAALTHPLILDLKANSLKKENEYQEMLKSFKPTHPDMKILQQQIDATHNKIEKEFSVIKSSMKADYLTAKRQEDRLREKLGFFKQEMYQLQDSTLEYVRLKREVSISEKLYNNLLQRLEEVSVAAAAITSSISILEPPIIPRKIYRPRTRINVMLGIMSGLIFGIGIAFLREALDKTIQTGKDLTISTGLPILGRIPTVKRKDKKHVDTIVRDLPNNPVSEAYRILSANIRLITKRLDKQIILVTSASMGEGKTVTASNIACTYAQMGKRVLLIDADLRRPSLHKVFNLDNDTGLSDYLKNDIGFVGITRPVTDVDGLFVITAGQVNSNPVSLLSNERMKYIATQGANVFDYVIIDSPPVIGFADALQLTSISTSTLIVAKQEDLNSQRTNLVLEKLMLIKPNVLGFLLVKAKNPEAREQFYLDYSEDPSTQLSIR